MKRLAVIGRGTVGCTTVAHFLWFTDWQIDWYYDPNIAPTPVGEGTNLAIVDTWKTVFSLHSDEYFDLQCTSKIGIMKRGWGKFGTRFLHPFAAGETGIHFSGTTFQDVMFQRLKVNNRVRLIEQNIEPEQVDSDYVICCTGTPKELNDNFTVSDNIPVNACLVSQCEWDHPRFDYSLTYAMPNGWVFGIPLRNRCSIGYVHNSNYASRELIEKEVQPLFDELGLSPVKQNYINFNNYYRKQNYSHRIAYNGNASFFLEPLEATSTGFADGINRTCFDFWVNKEGAPEQYNESYVQEIKNIELMICMHYAAGSVFHTPFWDNAQVLGKKRLDQGFAHNELFTNNLITALQHGPDTSYKIPSAGTWDTLKSFFVHVDNLNLYNILASSKSNEIF